MTGVLQGGGEFVVAAYALTAAVLGAYAASIIARYRVARRRPAGRQEDAR